MFIDPDIIEKGPLPVRNLSHYSPFQTLTPQFFIVQ
jgi:hypothetical protein